MGGVGKGIVEKGRELSLGKQWQSSILQVGCAMSRRSWPRMARVLSQVDMHGQDSRGPKLWAMADPWASSLMSIYSLSGSHPYLIGCYVCIFDDITLYLRIKK